jgi:Molybdopterin biosynthesis enzymes
MKVNIALLTVTDTRTIDNDKSGAILVKKIEEAKHNLIDRKICKDNKDDIVVILKNWLQNNQKGVIITTGGTG